MEDTYAILDENGKVLNLVKWDGDVSKWQPPDGTTVVKQSDLNGATFSSDYADTWTAEGWLDAQGYGGARPTTLLYLKLQLQAANKTSAKLTAAQSWLDGIISIGAQDPDAQHADLPAAPFAFAEVVQDALAQLTGGQ